MTGEAALESLSWMIVFFTVTTGAGVVAGVPQIEPQVRIDEAGAAPAACAVPLSTKVELETVAVPWNFAWPIVGPVHDGDAGAAVVGAVEPERVVLERAGAAAHHGRAVGERCVEDERRAPDCGRREEAVGRTGDEPAAVECGVLLEQGVVHCDGSTQGVDPAAGLVAKFR